MPSIKITLRARARLAAATLLTAVTVATSIGAPLPATASSKTPSVPSGLPAAIEPPASYVAANTCDPSVKKGVDKLGKLLVKTYGGSYGISRTCGTDLLATSEHYEGRAVDWMHNSRDKTDKKEAEAAIKWMLATDEAGNKYANARRLGIMYIIWNNKILGLYNADEGWRDYNGCAKKMSKSLDSTCHRNHVHFSLSWEGAEGRTSFWTKQVAAKDFGPCRPADLNWASTYRTANPVPCPRYAKVTAPKGSSTTMKTLVQYSGMELRKGLSGPIVTTVQKIVGTQADGKYGSETASKVKSWQKKHDLPQTGTITPDTWRALIADQAKK